MAFDSEPVSPIVPPNLENQSLDKTWHNPTGSASRIQRWASRFPEGYVIPLCGGVAGAVSGIVSCPLDVIKTKLQAQGGLQTARNSPKPIAATYRGIQGTAEVIWKEEGLKGMYRGLGPMLLGYVPTWAVYLTVYNKAQAYFRTKTGG
jgi:solute carrier family 25 (mitochondrial folate transporter), member 32